MDIPKVCEEKAETFSATKAKQKGLNALVAACLIFQTSCNKEWFKCNILLSCAQLGVHDSPRALKWTRRDDVLLP